jgi:branched-chain amino acid transport system permease protein
VRRYVTPVLVAAALVGVATTNWSGRSLDAESIFQLLILALPLAGIYALAATGLVVVYSTTGVFNFAQGGIGMLAAFVYWELKVNQEMPTAVALVATVFVFAPLTGLVLERLVMRHLVGKDLVVQLMVTVGLLFGFIGIANTVWDPNAGRSVPTLFGRDGIEIANITLTWHRLIALSVAVVLVGGLRFLLYSTRTGISMRAVVDNRGLAALAGIPAGRVSRVSWMLGCVLAALSGVLIAPETGMSAGGALTLATLVPGFAAAALGRMRSLPLAYAGALVLALLQQFSATFLSFGGRWAQVPARIPEMMLFATLLFLPAANVRFARITAVRRRGRVVRPREGAVGLLILALFIPFLGSLLTTTNLSRLTLAMSVAIVALSLVPLTGWAGQVSFAPLAFAGIGAAVFSQIGGAEGHPWAVLVAAALTAPVGTLLSLVAVRLQGLYLGLATFAFAFVTRDVILNQPFAFGGQSLPAPRQTWFGFDVSDNSDYLILATVVFGVVGVALLMLRNSAWGRRLVAMRDSEAASATVGVNLFETKVAVFTLSAAIAGLGGAFIAMYHQQVAATEFEALASLGLVLQMAIGGLGFITGAVFAGVFQLPIQIVIEKWPGVSLFRGLERVAPGFGALGIIQNPDGAVVAIGEGFAPQLPGRNDAKEHLRALRRQRAARYDVESAELGLSTPINVSAVSALERKLGVTADLAEAPA